MRFHIGSTLTITLEIYDMNTTTLKSNSQSAPFMSLLNFVGVSLLAGLSSAVVLAGVVLLISSAS
jgi:hypothetical protein